MQDDKLNRLIKVSLLGTISFLLMYIEVAVPLFPEFLKIDISDLPALIGAFALGPIQGVVIELFKNILHGLFGTKTAFVGELANFLVGGIMVFVAGYIYKKNKTKKAALLGLLVSTVVMSLSAGILNLYVFLPLYQKVLGLPISEFVKWGHRVNSHINSVNGFIYWAIIPFNLIKGIIVSIITMGIYKKVSILFVGKKENNRYIKKKETA